MVELGFSADAIANVAADWLDSSTSRKASEHHQAQEDGDLDDCDHLVCGVRIVEGISVRRSSTKVQIK